MFSLRHLPQNFFRSLSSTGLAALSTALSFRHLPQNFFRSLSVFVRSLRSSSEVSGLLQKSQEFFRSLSRFVRCINLLCMSLQVREAVA